METFFFEKQGRSGARIKETDGEVERKHKKVNCDAFILM